MAEKTPGLYLVELLVPPGESPGAERLDEISAHLSRRLEEGLELITVDGGIAYFVRGGAELAPGEGDAEMTCETCRDYRLRVCTSQKDAPACEDYVQFQPDALAPTVAASEEDKGDGDALRNPS